jgi:hypothetical protein
MIQLAQLINADSIKYIAAGFVVLTVGALGYKLGYDRGHIPKSEMCAEELIGLVQEREKFIACDVNLQAAKLRGLADCTFDRCQPLCVGASRKAVEDYIALEKEIVCTPAQ